MPESIDDRIFEKLHGGLRGFIAEVVADPRHELRAELDARLADLVERLQHDPDAHRPRRGAQGGAARPPGAAGVDGVGVGRRQGDPRRAGRRPRLAAAPRLETAVAGFGERLAADAGPAGQGRPRPRPASPPTCSTSTPGPSATIIRSTVERWDPGVVTGQLELLLGRDLQFIRINGTVVGGLIGLGLHAFGQVIG